MYCTGRSCAPCWLWRWPIRLAGAGMILRQLIRYGLTGVIHNVGRIPAVPLGDASRGRAEARYDGTVRCRSGGQLPGEPNLDFWRQQFYRRPMQGGSWSVLVGYMLNLSILLVFVDQLKYPNEWVQGFATIRNCVCTVCPQPLLCFQCEAP